jgi:hypothetical protein
MMTQKGAFASPLDFKAALVIFSIIDIIGTQIARKREAPIFRNWSVGGA